jgi:hypothetical protein
MTLRTAGLPGADFQPCPVRLSFIHIHLVTPLDLAVSQQSERRSSGGQLILIKKNAI